MPCIMNFEFSFNLQKPLRNLNMKYNQSVLIVRLQF